MKSELVLLAIILLLIGASIGLYLLGWRWCSGFTMGLCAGVGGWHLMIHWMFSTWPR